jgi:Domain of unknown function (DUF4367)
MEPTFDTTWERSLEQVARRFDYPATPNIAAAVRTADDGRRTTRSSASADDRLQPAGHGRRSAAGRRLAWALIIIALLAAGAFAVPQTRAAILSFFARIGAIGIFIDETAPAMPTAAPTVDETGFADPPTAAPVASVAPTATISGAVDHSMALFELGEPTSLDEAKRTSHFPLSIPSLLGEPDEVYIHRNVDLPAITLVWRDPDGVPISLTEIGIAEFANKLAHENGVKSLRVGGLPAVWLVGPHTLQLLGNWQADSLLIESNVLIWAADGVTYRLEGDLTEEEMVAIAESLGAAE